MIKLNSLNEGLMAHSKQQSGVALITVMLVVAVAVVLATKMSSALIFQIQRTDNLNSNQQAYWHAMGAEAFAKSVLTLSFKEKDDKEVTHLGQIWASGETSFPVDLGSISGEIKDMQACFNLNSLINKEQDNSDSSAAPGSSAPSEDEEKGKPGASASGKKIENMAKVALIELISSLNIDGVGNFEAESMSDALLDWLDEDSSIVSAGGAEDNDYAAKEYPYLAANGLLASVNELRLIEHFSPQVIYALKDHVCVIPNSEMHKININTIDEEHTELLQALLGGVDASVVEEIFSQRGEEGFKTIDDFYSVSAVTGLQDFDQFKRQFVVDSEYFKLITKTSFNDSYFSMNSIMKINKDETISVVNRSVGEQ
ncbi:type II secretion system minor pseudopilin GspK [Thalassotalea sp. ND16A]|uniref:type II secretion system minor pseudopilin GspK n=1 Tax=Thalassotalea sp. ND16A TaxID=1535422 RepID=UPI00051D294C|nr:type II secretion system minor pseudopilin GspK [Thalassotalea sp. ND16A]KGJ98108.1 hypothetical protein ND16A_0913 [Thalassotalea sp. ND16A]